MRRLCRSSPAALRYQHAADDHDAEVARALDAMLGAITDPARTRTGELRRVSERVQLGCKSRRVAR